MDYAALLGEHSQTEPAYPPTPTVPPSGGNAEQMQANHVGGRLSFLLTQ